MTSEVSISCRVIAAGVTAGGKFRLTLSLMPVGPGAGTRIDMMRWPRGIREFLMKGNGQQGLALVAKAVKTAADKEAPSGKSHGIAIPYSFPETDSEGIQKLWNEIADAARQGGTPVPKPEVFWQDVAMVFQDAPGETYVDGSAGKAIPIVMSTGRGDAAILHLLDQLKRLTARIAQADLPTGSDTGNASAKPPIDSWAKVKDEGSDAYSSDQEHKDKLLGILKAAQDEERTAIDKAAMDYFETQNKPYLLGGKTALPTTLTSFPIKKLFDDDDGKALEQTRLLHLAALLKDDDSSARPKNVPKASDLEACSAGAPVGGPSAYIARNFVAAVRSSSMLARLFGFVVDVEIDPSAIDLGYVTPPGSNEAPYAFVLLGAGEQDTGGDVDAGAMLFSIAKATRPRPGEGGRPGFWPVTREEVDDRLDGLTMANIRATGKVSQVDGVADLGQAMGAPTDDGYNPRFDIISIDPVFAMEASVRNANKATSLKDSADRLGLDGSSVRTPFHDEPERGIVGRGLAIVDRWRALSVSEEILTAAAHAVEKAKARIVDGDDLTIGYRVDVAVRIGEDNTAEWRSLMEREIDYRRLGHDPKAPDDLARWFKALSLDRMPQRKGLAELEYEADRRRDYDAGIAMPTSRRRLRAGDREMIHAEELITAWEGDPLGLNCGQETIPIRPGADVAINRTFYLPHAANEEEHKTWPLRYGWAYRFGIRPVWLGGVSLPMVEAVSRYDSNETGYQNLALPGASANIAEPAANRGAPPSERVEVKGWRRFLRYEPILAPIVLLPDVVASEKPHFLPQSGIRAILRTLESGNAWTTDKKNPFNSYSDRQTDSTWRVILPPRISLDEAVRHGVFDGLKEVGVTPPGDLLQIDYDAGTEKRAHGVRGSEQVLGQKTAFPSVTRTSPVHSGDPGEGVPQAAYEDFFRVHPKAKTASERGDASQQYYVDPMADRLVVALRPNNNRVGQGYFEGERRVFEIRAKNGTVLPVALNIKRDARKPRKETSKLQQKEFWEAPTAIRNVSGEGFDLAKSGGSVPASVATLQLRAGESVEIDCWFVPSLEKMRAYFGWPEALAVKAAADTGAPSGNKVADYRALLIAKLQEVLKKNLAGKNIDEIQRRYLKQSAWVGLGGKMADPVAVAAAAEILHRHMLQCPIPEISAVKTIDVVHAVAKPPRAPKIGADFVLLRAPSDVGARQQLLAQYKPGDWIQAHQFGNEGDDGVIFAGSVEMDRSTCRQLEILAHCTSPARVLDDVRLGRTELQRLLGEWPNRVVPLNEGDEDQTADSKRFKLTPSALHLFGFDVDEEGNVYFPKQTITLLQLEDLAERDAKSKFTGLETIDLVDEQKRTLARLRQQQDKQDKQNKQELASGAIRAAGLDHYADRLARRIVVSLRATSRFDPYFVRLTPTAGSPLPETVFPPIPEQVDLIRRLSYQAEPFEDSASEAEKQAALQAQLRVMWIPATIAPAKPQVHAVLPSYDIQRPSCEDGVPAHGRRNTRHWQYCRRPRLRVVLDRPWYSSGDGERLGVVLWPPRLVEIGSEKNDAERLKSGKVPRSVLHAFDKGNDLLMELKDFEDEDLGSGGKFTTRWGADPIRDNSDPIGPFLPREALLNGPSTQKRPLPAVSEPAGEKDEPACKAIPTPAVREWEGQQVGYVPSIALPLRDLRQDEEQAEKDRAANKPVNEPEMAYETLTAALATYVPRFDVENEKWFVDLAFNPDLLVEPFIRLGLVRYQAQAAEPLRASAPVSVWAQIPPVRTVDVWACTDAAGDTVVEVQVCGKASGRASTDAGKSKGGDLSDLVYPRMRISVLEAATTLPNVKIERIAAARKIETKNGVSSDATDTARSIPAETWAEWAPPEPDGCLDSALSWRAIFVLPPQKNEQGKIKKRTLAVVVEEVEEFLSTANDASPRTIVGAPAPASADAPQDAKNTQGLNAPGPTDIGRVHSGPRFLARIDLDYDEAKYQPGYATTGSLENGLPSISGSAG